MDMERIWDQRLQIDTCGRDDVNSDEYRYPYEPTPYSVLERLTASGLIRKKDTVLDYGCGKGRVEFFLTHETGAKTVGIEYDERIYRCAVENRNSANVKPEFLLERAENYVVPCAINRFYFFNPFSVQILRRVIARILDSYYENPRKMMLFFYYPSDEYISYLMTVGELEFYDEIECDDLFIRNDIRERILIFEIVP